MSHDDAHCNKIQFSCDAIKNTELSVSATNTIEIIEIVKPKSRLIYSTITPITFKYSWFKKSNNLRINYRGGGRFWSYF